MRAHHCERGRADIPALYGLTHRLINESQYTELVTVVILSALVPTLIDRPIFRPTLEVSREDLEALGEEDISLRHRPRERPDDGAVSEP